MFSRSGKHYKTYNIKKAFLNMQEGYDCLRNEDYFKSTLV